MSGVKQFETLFQYKLQRQALRLRILYLIVINYFESIYSPNYSIVKINGIIPNILCENQNDKHTKVRQKTKRLTSQML